MEADYAVIRCTRLKCGKFSYCKAKQKTKKCPYCGRVVKLNKIKPIPAKTTVHARKMVQEFNRKLGELTEPSWYKPEKTADSN
ncbi:MAG: DUF1922 domain-containing protein [Candidatus Heimdallarchaeota archaeon]|nr:DUF1922 domain-containing protein [Candidatus Heimdallarchaeota archaeon]MCK4876833.1 DUF1922 domain-containing protein [Candidatus Heimdallarchaeota archaeon]